MNSLPSDHRVPRADRSRGARVVRDDADAVSDRQLSNAQLNTPSGATRVLLHHGGVAGMGATTSPTCRCCNGTR